MNVNKIYEKIATSRQLDFGEIFNDCLELFKKVWQQGLVNSLLAGVVGIVISLIFYIPLFMILGAFGIAMDSVGGSGGVVAIPMAILMLLTMLFIIILASAITMAFTAGFFRICKQKDHNEVGADDYFYFFKRKYASTLLSLSAASMGIAIVAAMLCYFPIFYVMIPLTYFSVVFAFNPNLSASEIINVSFKLGNKKWFLTFGLVFVAGMLAQIVGILMCGVGIFLTASFAQLPLYFIYKEVVGFDDDLDEIGTLIVQ